MDSSVDRCAHNWALLKKAAIATGAFPGVLASQSIDRRLSDYLFPPIPGASEVPLGYDFASFDQDSIIKTLNVDGGVTNNNPYELATRYLEGLSPFPPLASGRDDLKHLDRALVTISPFPLNIPAMWTNQNVSTRVTSILLKVVAVLLTQSRFLTETAPGLWAKHKSGFRFVIEPTLPIASRALGAFAGFLDYTFRVHDYQLGRRACQKFLKSHFALPVSNSVIRDGLDAAAEARRMVLNKFALPSPPGLDSEAFVPIIPLCGPAAAIIPRPDSPTFDSRNVEDIAKRAKGRAKAILNKATRNSPLWFKLIVEPQLQIMISLSEPFIRRWMIAELEKSGLRQRRQR